MYIKENKSHSLYESGLVYVKFLPVNFYYRYIKENKTLYSVLIDCIWINLLKKDFILGGIDKVILCILIKEVVKLIKSLSCLLHYGVF
jgi:hypothetical protein